MADSAAPVVEGEIPTLSEAEILSKLQNMPREEVKKLLRTPPNDPRYPNANQANHCYSKYNEFFRCQKFYGNDAKECYYLKQAYFSMCPSEWYERWDEQREKGTFPGPL